VCCRELLLVRIIRYYKKTIRGYLPKIDCNRFRSTWGILIVRYKSAFSLMEAVVVDISVKHSVLMGYDK